MYLGIEIGGTKLQLGLGAGDGVVTALWRGAVNAWNIGRAAASNWLIGWRPRMSSIVRNMLEVE